MGRSYNLKNSPINKGTAAKPSPNKAIFTGALLGLAAGAKALFTGAAVKGTAAVAGKYLAGAALSKGIQSTTKGIKDRKESKTEEKNTLRQTSSNIHANMQKGITKDISTNKTNLLA